LLLPIPSKVPLFGELGYVKRGFRAEIVASSADPLDPTSRLLGVSEERHYLTGCVGVAPGPSREQIEIRFPVGVRCGLLVHAESQFDGDRTVITDSVRRFALEIVAGSRIGIRAHRVRLLFGVVAAVDLLAFGEEYEWRRDQWLWGALEVGIAVPLGLGR
jgi:hypothetical protein